MGQTRHVDVSLQEDWLDGGRLDLILDIIAADTIYLADGALPASPTVNSLARFIASGGTALGTQLPASKSLYDGLSGGISAVNRVAGKTQVFVKSITSAANAGDVTIATITTQPCIIDSIIIHADTAAQTDLTSAAISGGASKVITFIDATDAAKANIDAVDEQVAWTGAVRLAAAKTIVMSLVGGGATVVDLTVIITFHSEVDGGYLV